MFDPAIDSPDLLIDSSAEAAHDDRYADLLPEPQVIT